MTIDIMTSELMSSAALNAELQEFLRKKKTLEKGATIFGHDPNHIGAKDMQHAARIFQTEKGLVGLEVSESEDISTTVLLEKEDAEKLHELLSTILEVDSFSVGTGSMVRLIDDTYAKALTAMSENLQALADGILTLNEKKEKQI